MNIFLKRIICNEIIRLYTKITMHFLKGIYLWKKKKKKIFIIVIIISLSTHTHTNTDIHISESQTFWNQVNAS